MCSQGFIFPFFKGHPFIYIYLIFLSKKKNDNNDYIDRIIRVLGYKCQLFAVDQLFVLQRSIFHVTVNLTGRVVKFYRLKAGTDLKQNLKTIQNHLFCQPRFCVIFSVWFEYEIIAIIFFLKPVLCSINVSKSATLYFFINPTITFLWRVVNGVNLLFML